MMKVDTKDPVVKEEFLKVNEMDLDEVSHELEDAGLYASPTMSDYDLKILLVEVRLKKSGKIGTKKKAQQKKPASFANAFEEALYEKPAFKEYFENLRKERKTNQINLVSEYMSDPKLAAVHHSDADYYDEVLKEVEAILKFKPELTSPKISFSGFPAMMGEPGIRSVLAQFGELVDLTVEETEDERTCFGTAEWGDLESAKSAVEQWDGKDMGGGDVLELAPFSR
jgi:hypothetical protein